MDNGAGDVNMYDYYQEVSNTAFGDMLHDTERNEKYEQALCAAIAKVQAAGNKAHVLDIGTGTGIFAMMAVRAGADSVHACERFMPMAHCAERIINLNKMSDKICLIKKSSLQIKIGIDMPHKANILVAELLDTELIGEGAITIYNHAHKELLTNDVICIPSKAICYVQLCSSRLSETWNGMKLIVNDDCDKMLEPPYDILLCRGTRSLHDMQLSMLPMEHLEGLSVSKSIFEFNFSSKTPIPTDAISHTSFDDVEYACLNTLVFWWDIHFDLVDNLKLSCAPIWARPADELAKLNGRPITIKDIPWREHWVQALYYLPRPLDKPTDIEIEEIPMVCCHDTFSFWFDEVESIPPRCTCDFHMAHSRNRIGQLNNMKRNKKFVNFITEKFVAEKGKFNVLTLGDSCVVGLTHAWSKSVETVYAYENYRFSRSFIQKTVETNELENVIILEGELRKALPLPVWENVTHLFGEPYFHDCELPWDSMGKFAKMYYEVQDMLPSTVKISPHAIQIYAVPMQFDNLQKLKQTVGTVQGFNMAPFDEILQESRKHLPQIEAHSLWEYGGIPLGKATPIHTFELEDWEESATQTKIDIKMKGKLNGVALWIDTFLDDSFENYSEVSGGPTKPVKVGEPIEWNLFERQAVYFMPTIQDVDPEEKSVLTCLVIHEPVNNHYNFKFELKHGETMSSTTSESSDIAE